MGIFCCFNLRFCVFLIHCQGKVMLASEFSSVTICRTHFMEKYDFGKA